MTQNKPKVSVILTSFNHAKYLREAIDSVLNQTFNDFELIIWDDASSDNSWEIIQSYQDPRIKAFRNDVQRRGTYGINKAISEVAQGDYIAIHHSDDVWTHEKLEKQVAFLDENKNIGAVFSNALAIDEDSKPLTDKSHFYYKIFDQPNRTRHEWLRHFFEKGNALCHPSVLIRMRCYQECGLYRYGFAQVGDFDMWIRLAFKYDIHVLPDKLVHFRVRDNEANTSGNRPETRARGLYEYSLLLNHYRQLDTLEDLVKVFPEAQKYCSVSKPNLRYGLAMAILEMRPSYFYIQYALNILFEVVNDPESTSSLEFNTKDLIKLTGELDPLQVFRIENLSQALAERDEQIASLQQAIVHRDEQIGDLDRSVREMLASRSWRLTRPLRWAGTFARKVRSLIIVLPLIMRTGGGLGPTMRKSLRVLRNEGLTGIRIRVRRFLFSYPFSDGLIVRSQSVTDADVSSPAIFSIVPYYLDPKLCEEDAPDRRVSIAIHLHLHYTEMLDQFVTYLNNIPYRYDLYVSIAQTSDANGIRTSLQQSLIKAGNVIVEAVPNRGRDIAPMIVQFGKRLAQYEIIAHVHSKKSPHNGNLAGWCQHIMDLLFAAPGSRGGHVGQIIGKLQDGAKIVFPEPPAQLQILMDKTGWAANHELARQFLGKYTQISIDEFPVVEFPVGSMFWARAECLQDFLQLPLTYDDFPAEPIPADGTLAHVLERLILIFASKHQGQCLRLHHGDSIRDYRHYEEQLDFSAALAQTDIKVLSYYLPQFHPIPENDEWHGKGFTEWTKVRAANPLFEGHYQQHIPHADTGYYLLDTPDTLRRQAGQMKKAGVHGQVFYHYWFGGKLILEEPAQLLRANPDIDMPYCFCWANENWTRRWDGNENEILLGQDYSAQDAAAFIRYLIPFFKDKRYIRIEGRPVLFIYRPSSIPHPNEYLEIWAQECAQAGVGHPYVVAVLTRGATDPKDFGMDAGVERVLHDWTSGAAPEIKDKLNTYRPFNGSALAYEDVAAFYMAQPEKKKFTYFRSLVPIWDNTARYGAEAYLLHGSTPQRFQAWLEHLIGYTRATLPEDRRFILINAWNEWAEGAHLEPDSRYGYSYLNSVGRALSGIPYATDVLPEQPLSSGLRIHMEFPEPVLDQLRSDAALRQRFIDGLSRSSIFEACNVSVDVPELASALADKIIEVDLARIDYVLQFRKIAFFAPCAIEKMAKLACASRNSVVLSNAYDSLGTLIEATENGSVRTCVAHESPIALLPLALARSGFKNYRVRTDAHSFVTYSAPQHLGKLPEVTTIIRFHKTGNVDSLGNALYCLAAMEGCRVTPLIAAQDLSEQQTAKLEALLGEIPWALGVSPIIHHYRSPGGVGDLRSRMLNESLRQVKTQYAGFLDFDDLLMSHAYRWLIDRLRKTGKAVSFGRVYRTGYVVSTGRYLNRERAFEFGFTYEDFLYNNTAPLHSFILDLEKLDPSQATYFDDHYYMEDYYLILQLFTPENADWEGMAQNMYIGDYIHSIDRSQTLALNDEQQRQALLNSPEYRICEQRVDDMRIAIRARMKTGSRAATRPVVETGNGCNGK